MGIRDSWPLTSKINIQLLFFITLWKRKQLQNLATSGAYKSFIPPKPEVIHMHDDNITKISSLRSMLEVS